MSRRSQRRNNKIAINAMLGDGCLRITGNGKNAVAMFNGKDRSWIDFKRSLAIREGYTVSEISAAYSGFKDDWSLVKFSTHTHTHLTDFLGVSRAFVIRRLSKLDLIMWYIDDGSWHRAHNTMHLYCNMLVDYEVEALQDRIEELYGVRPNVHYDKKRDGRCFPYLYFPRKLVVKFVRHVRLFLRSMNLPSLYYKFGERSTTIA